MKKSFSIVLIVSLFVLTFVGCQKSSVSTPAAEPTQPEVLGTFTATCSVTPTQTPVVSATATFTKTMTSTALSTSSNTPTRTATRTNTPVITSTFTSTATRTVTRTSTRTSTPTFTSTNTANATQTYVVVIATQTAVAVPAYSGQFGLYGSGNGQFNLPSGITVIGSNVYVSDRNNKRIQQFTTAGTYVRQWGDSLSFVYPQGIDGYNSGTEDIVFITDSTKIKKFGIAGTTPVYYGASAENFGGGSNGAWGGSMVTVSGNQFYYVPDSDNNLIKKMDLSIVKQSQFGTAGTGTGELNMPSAIAPDNRTTSLYLYVADTANNRIHKFTTAGVYVLTWGGLGTADGKFSSPYGVAVDSRGFVYVSDMNNRIQKFDSSGNYLSKWGTSGTGNGAFDFPGAIFITGDVFYIVDAYNNRIQKFSF